MKPQVDGFYIGIIPHHDSIGSSSLGQVTSLWFENFGSHLLIGFRQVHIFISRTSDDKFDGTRVTQYGDGAIFHPLRRFNCCLGRWNRKHFHFQFTKGTARGVHKMIMCHDVPSSTPRRQLKDRASHTTIYGENMSLVFLFFLLKPIWRFNILNPCATKCLLRVTGMVRLIWSVSLVVVWRTFPFGSSHDSFGHHRDACP